MLIILTLFLWNLSYWHVVVVYVWWDLGVCVSVANYFTMWKFQDFSVTHILREINFGEIRTSKNGVFAILAALNVVNLADISLKEVQKFIKIKIQSL